MKKFLYIMPAVLTCMLYALLMALAGTVTGLQPIAYINILLPIVSGVLLRKGKWWGCLLGIAMGSILLIQGMTAQPQLFAGFVIGIIIIAYYCAMGLMCAFSQKA